ncbi:MAG: MFS transporter [Deltaproteobacteria bacterium]|jgi:MFS family permease|nr:MFS transporter [Deltaproteobacteria bacterium]
MEAATTEQESELFPPQHGAHLWTGTFVTILFINFTNFLGFYMLLPTLSVYLTQEGCPEGEIGLVIGSFTACSIIFRLLSITLARRYGGRAVVRAGLITIAIGTLFFFLIRHTGSYVLARLLEGAGFGVTSTLIVSMASEIIPPAHMAEGLGYMGLGNTMAMGMGPLLGMFLSGEWGFVVMFSTMSGLSLVAAAITLLLPNISLFVLPAHITKKKPGLRNRLDKRPLPAASLGLFYGVSICSVTAYLGIYANQANLPSAALFFLVSTIGTLIARLTTGKIYDHRGDMVIIPPAVIILLLSFVLILHATTGHTKLYYFAAIVYGVGIGSVFPSVQTLALSSVPHSKRSVGVATFFVLYDFGTGVGTALLGVLSGHFKTYRVVFDAAVVSSAIILIVYAIFYIIPSQRRRRLANAKKED